MNEVIKMDDEKDVEELKEMMNTLKDTVPAIIKGIVDALYSGQNAEEFGKQVANFYKSMVDAGMDKKDAYELTKEFMESRDITGVVKKIISQGNWGDWKNSGMNAEEIAEEVNKKVNEEMKKEEGKE